MSPQAKFHVLAVSLLESGLRGSTPKSMRTRRGMTVTWNGISDQNLMCSSCTPIGMVIST